MRKFWVLWTYIANYSERPIEVTAKDEDEARKMATGFYEGNPKWNEHSTVYVFNSPPVIYKKGVRQ